MKVKKAGFIKQIKQKLSIKNTEKSTNTSLKDSQNAVLSDATPFVITEAYKTTRTNIIFSVAGATEKPCKIIVFTSSNPSEGKTTTSLNMAITFAQTGARVLILDGDLRKPKLHQYLKKEKTKGLSAVLVDEYTWQEAIEKDIWPNLDFLASGPIPPNPAELLSSHNMEALLEELSQYYDYILIDTPPVNVVTDATTLSKFVAGYIMVVRQNHTHHESIAQAINLLNIADAKILGFFCNDVSDNSSSYSRYKRGYRYKYKYNYQYGYKYGYEPELQKKVKKQDKPIENKAENKIVKEEFNRAVLTATKKHEDIKYVPMTPEQIQKEDTPSPDTAAQEKANESAAAKPDTKAPAQTNDTK